MKYIKILYYDFKISIMKEMAFKANFFMRFMSDSIFLIIYYIFYNVIFRYVSSINGWNKYEVLLLMGTFHIVLSLFLAIFFPNITQITNLVKSGELDGLIIKPVSSQFLVSCRATDIGSLVNVILGILIVLSSYTKLGLEINPQTALMYIGYIVIGVSIMYSLLFILSATAFWLLDSSWSIGFFMTFNSFADKPLSIYKGIISRVLIYLFPIGLVANIPTNILLKRRTGILESIIIIIGCLLFTLTKYIWHIGIKRYEAASS